VTPQVAYALGFVGAALAFARYLPQLLRLHRTQQAHGVSLASLGAGAVSGLGWASYSLQEDVHSVTVASIAAVCIYTACLVQAKSLSRGRIGPIPLLWAGGLVGVQLVLGTVALGLALAASAVVTGLPQLREVLARVDLSGVSSLTWGLAVIEGALWLGIGAVSRDLPVLIWASGQLVVGGPVLIGVLRSHALVASQRVAVEEVAA
jgi:uncharacterized protein with PQ loop repeat